MKPLLAATLEDPNSLPMPVLVSAKFDGIRALKYQGKMVSRNLKPIRNEYIQRCLADLPEGFDGELIVGAPNEGLVFNRTTSGVMSADGHPDFKFHVFDRWDSPMNYLHRYNSLKAAPRLHCVEIVKQILVKNVDEFYDLEDTILQAGYEGVMVRTPMTGYKFGRATHREAIIWKYKRFTDGEAKIEYVVEGMRNNNVAKTNELGYRERSTHQDNMVPSGMIGTIVARDLVTNELMDISPGKMDHDDRIRLLHAGLTGKIVKYKVFNYGRVNAPRFATFQGFRDVNDL